MKKFMTTALATLMATSLIGCSSTTTSTTSTTAKSSYKVAIVKQLDHASLDEIANAICDELDVLAKENGVEIDYGEVYSGQNDQTTLQQIGSQVVSDGVDVIIPIATLAAQTMTVASDGAIPVVYAAISDPDAAELTDIDYVTGTSDALNTEQIMEMIFAENPGAKTIGLLYSKSEANSEAPIEDAKAYLDNKGIEYVEATANTDDEVKQAAASLIGSKVDAIFTPTDNVIMAAELSIAPDLAEAGIPHYTGADSFVRNGAFATCGVNYTDLGKETADLAFKAMSAGMEATGFKGRFEIMPGGIITINTETAKILGADYSVFESFGEISEVTTTED